MKRRLLLAFLFAGTVAAYAQAPSLLNYQGVARSTTGSPLAGQLIGLRLTVHDGSATGTTVYQETQSATTNAFGLYNISIGNGTVVSGTFAGIAWGGGNKYLEVEIDPAGGATYTSVGTTKLLSVPYALYANTAGSASTANTLTGTVTMGGDVTGTNAAANVVKLQGKDISPTAPTAGQYLAWNAGTSSWTPTTDGGGTVTSVATGAGLTGGPITGSGTISMPNVGTPGTYGDATHYTGITTDAQGRVSGVTTYTMTAGTVTNVSSGNLSPLFTSSVATPSSTPSITYSLTPAPPSTFLGGATTGTVTPTYRSLVASDIPSLPYVSSVTAGAGLSGGTITSTGTISMPNVGTAGAYGDATHFPKITTDAQGRVTAVTTFSVTPGITTVNTTPGQLTGGPITSSGTLGLATVGTAGTYGTGTTVPQITTDAYGRVTGVTNVPIASGGIGTVTSVAAGAGLSGGTITSSGTISMPNVGTAGTYGSATQVPVFTTDAQGRITGVTNTAISAGSGTVTTVNTTAGQLTGGPITGSGTIGLATAGTAGTYGSATQIPVFTTDAYGRVTAVTNTTLTAGTVSSVTAGTGLSGGTITTTGTISLPNVGTAGTYGSATQVPVITTDAQGRVTGITNTTIPLTSGTVTTINTTPGQLTGGPITSSGTIGLATAGTAGTYGSATSVPVITTDAYGRVTGVTNTGITGLINSGTINYLSKFTSATALGNSSVFDNGTTVGVGTATPTNMSKLHISGIGTYSVAPVFQAGVIVDGTTTASATGVYASGGWKGVFGHNLGTSVGTEAIGVLGRTEGSSYTGTGYGVKGEMAGTGGTSNYGVYGTASGSGRGLGGFATGSGAAGYFDGGTSGLGVVVNQGPSGFYTTAPTNMARVHISGVGTYSVSPIFQAGLVVDGTTTASASGIYASGGWKGVFGHNLGTSVGTEAIGVLGRTEGSSYTGTGYGVKGEMAGTGGTSNYGVYGTASGSGRGLGGFATGSGAAGYFDGGTSGLGVVVNQGPSGFYITTPSNMSRVHISGVGTYSVSPVYQAGLIVDGTTTASATGVYAAGGWKGVFGHNLGTSVGTEAIGVLGRTEGSSYTGTGYGVKGEMAGTGGTSNYGVYGTASGSGRGIGGFATGSGAAGYFDGGTSGYGILVNQGQSGFGVLTPAAMLHVSGSKDVSVTLGGVNFAHQSVIGATSATSTGQQATGVVGFAQNSTFENHGVHAFARGAGGSAYNVGIFSSGTSTTTSTGNSYGVYGTASNGTFNYGIYGTASTGTAYAGYFAGNLTCTGTMSKGGGSFKIDHPLDPENKYLYHSFVESPDMMNIYNGNVVTDANGDATITMPNYFDALNKDFRYQLTVLGTFAQAIVKDEMNGNTFTIKTDKPNVKVSWQVTGVRQDKFANEHRIVPEVDKEPELKGYYLHAAEYGQPETKSINYITAPRSTREVAPPVTPEQPKAAAPAPEKENNSGVANVPGK